MVLISSEGWVADLETMTCRNCVNNIVVAFKRSGKTLVGQISDMPVKLISSLAAEHNGERFITDAVMEAEEVFLRAYYDKKRV